MNVTIKAPILVEILKETALQWANHANELRQLDAIAGDGDLGVTVELASKAMLDYLSEQTEEDIGKLLMKCGMQINKASPSTFGTLLASAFLEAGKTVTGRKELQFGDMLMLGIGAVEGIKKRGKAETGDKTILDALIPAVQAFREGLTSGNDNKIVLESVTSAARSGAEATAKMKAKYGRVSYRQDGGIGIQDAGATAIYYLIEAFNKNLIAYV